jgi:hypothetical protein
MGEASVFEGLVEQVEGPIEQIDGDGAYDTRRAYEVAISRKARLVVPPRDNAIPWEDGHPRNDALRQIAEQGMAAWKKAAGYHCRSLAVVPCTASSSCLMTAWLPGCSKPK